ncbi:MAG: OmpA family protein [Bacteroidales bacterium]|nr:OmpA family protein [Bacteroidales bacterium]
MLKKLLKIGMVAGLLVAATSTLSAQDSPEYPHYGFWSNWSIGASVDFDKQANGHGMTLKEGTSIGGAIFLEKELNYVWDLRLRASMPGMMTDWDLRATQRYAMFGMLTAGFKFSVNDALMGYDPERRGSFYLFGDAGVAIWRNYVNCEPPTGAQHGRKLNLAMDAGLGYSYKVSKHSTIFAEAELIDVAHIPNIFKSNHLSLDALVSLGYAFNFGVTAADEELLAQRSNLTQENLDALNDQIANLEKQVATGKQQEKKLEGRIADLESKLAEDRAPATNNQASKELQDKINQIKADQLTFYALPFSIQYDVNQYTVSESEHQKLKAIARVMKDNPSTKYVVYGFADYTGSDEYNMKLSQKRAEEVKRQLVNKYGIAENRLEAKWNGKNTPFGDVKYSVNRRVSIYRVIE